MMKWDNSFILVKKERVSKYDEQPHSDYLMNNKNSAFP